MTDTANGSGDASGGPGPTTFSDAVTVFLAAIETARDLEQFIWEHREDLFGVEASFVRIAARIMPNQDVEQHQRAAKIIHDLIHERADVRSSPKMENAPQEDIERLMDDYERRISDAIFDLTGRFEDNFHYATVWRITTERPPSGRILRASLLMAAVSDFEVLISAVVRQQLAAKPDILRSNDQKFSFQDLEGFGSIEEFRKHLGDKMADGLLRGGFEDWMEWFAKRHKLNIPGVTDCPVELVEVFQRRHLLVHNGGVVNDYYLSKVAGLNDLPSVGMPLRVTAKYLRRALDILTIAGTKLAFGVAYKLFPGESATLDDSVSTAIYKLLQEGRYEAVHALSEWHLTCVTNNANRLVAMVNSWLSQKRLQGLSAIEREVEEWDTTTLAGRFQLVRLALLDRNDEAYELAMRLMAGEELTESQWHTWPVLEGVRAYGATNDMAPARGLYDTPHTDGDEPVGDPSSSS